MFQRTMQLRLVNQDITRREEIGYVRERQQTLQQLWVDEDKRVEDWRDIPIITTKQERIRTT